MTKVWTQKTWRLAPRLVEDLAARARSEQVSELALVTQLLEEGLARRSAPKPAAPVMPVATPTVAPTPAPVATPTPAPTARPTTPARPVAGTSVFAK